MKRRGDNEPATIGDLRRLAEIAERECCMIARHVHTLWWVSGSAWVSVLILVLYLLAGKAGAQDHRQPSGPSLLELHVLEDFPNPDALDTLAFQGRQAVEAALESGLFRSVVWVSPDAVNLTTPPVTLTTEAGSLVVQERALVVEPGAVQLEVGAGAQVLVDVGLDRAVDVALPWADAILLPWLSRELQMARDDLRTSVGRDGHEVAEAIRLAVYAAIAIAMLWLVVRALDIRSDNRRADRQREAG